MSSVYPANLKPCAFCGRSFQPAARKRRYCSRSCAASGSNAPRRIPLRPCAYCGTPFRPTKKVGVFCSRSCARRARGIPKGFVNAGSFRKGGTSWNKGMHDYGRGRIVSAEVRAKLRQRRGPLSPGWKGGVSAADELARKRAEYADWRRAVFGRDDYTCQACGRRSIAGQRVRLNADHIKPFALYPDLRYDVSNGRTLCEDCHRQTPTYGNGSRRN